MSETTINLVTSIRILKVASCSNSSGKATLTYHIGCTTDNDIQFRVTANTGGGLFSPEWISLSAIQPAFEQAPFPLTSYPLINLYQGKSTNTPSFLMAALKNEGFVRNLEGKVRGYEIIDSTAFMDEMNALMASEVDLKVANISAEYKTSYAIKKSVAPISKSATAIKVKKSSQPVETPIVVPEASIAA
jgi:hypothetical protein